MKVMGLKNSTNIPYMITAFGERTFGNQYRMGNRVYSSDYIAVALVSQSVGSMGGQTNLYLVIEDG